jgi:hypothetical protein
VRSRSREVAGTFHAAWHMSFESAQLLLAAPAAASRQVKRALNEYRWKQITAFRSRHSQKCVSQESKVKG